MNQKVDYCGVSYDDSTDWRDLIAHPYVGLEKELDAQSALGALSEALRGTTMEIGLADAALAVIERGDIDEMEKVRQAGWERAPNAFERILALVMLHSPVTSPTWVGTLFGALFRIAPTNKKLLDAFIGVARRDSELLEYPARYNPAWLAAHLRALRPPTTAELYRWIWVAATPERGGVGMPPAESVAESRSILLSAIAGLGQAYRCSLIQQVVELPPDSPVHAELLRALAAHPAFADQI